MAGLMIVLIFSLAGIVKWSGSMNEGEPDWRATLQGNLEMEKASLATNLLKGQSKRHAEENVQIYEYRLANDIAPLNDTSREGMIYNPSVGSIAILLTVIVAAGIVASEFSQGTIKMLLTRPVKRWKIMTSKYMAVLLFGFLLMLIGFVTTIVSAFLFSHLKGASTCSLWREYRRSLYLGPWSLHVTPILWQCDYHGNVCVHGGKCLPIQWYGNWIIPIHLLHWKCRRCTVSTI